MRMGSTVRRARIRVALVTFLAMALAPTASAQGTDESVRRSSTGTPTRSRRSALPKLTPSNAILTMGLVQAAVYDAVVSIAGGYAPYVGPVEADPSASQAAAAASAAHGMLMKLFPDQAADLDAKLEVSLAAIEDGEAKDAGMAVGEAAVAAILAARDGRRTRR